MSKTVIITEDAVNRLGLRLNPVLYKMLKNGDTSLGKNPALPDDALDFQYKVLKDGMTVAVDDMKSIGVNIDDVNAVIDELRHMIREVISLEKPIKSKLEALCYNSVLELFTVPDGTVNLKCVLGNPRDGGKVQIRLMPEEDGEYSFEDVDDTMMMQAEVAKRRMVDCLIMGGSYNLCNYIKEYWQGKINEMDDRLPELYDKIEIYERYLLYADSPKLSDEDPMMNAYVSVRLGGDTKRIDIESTGIIFPFLLRETIRGFMELFSSHGLPSDNERAMEIIRRSDFMVAEPWDIRLGIVLWDKFWNVNEFGSRTIPYYFRSVCEMGISEFNSFIKEQMLKTKRSKKMMLDLISAIYADKEREKFVGRMKKKQLDQAVIDDGDMSVDDLDSVLVEDLDSELEKEIVKTGGTCGYLYHATPSCNISSIKKYGLGGKLSKTRFWDYKGTPYDGIKQGCFLANDPYIAESFLEASDEFWDLSDAYEDRYDKELEIVVFAVLVSELDRNKLSIDENNSDEENKTFFYDGVIPFDKLKIIKL